MRLRRRPWTLTPSVFSLLLAAAAAPQEAWERAPFKSEPADLLAACKAVKAEPDVSAVILLNDVRWIFEADGRAEYRSHLLYQLRTQDGVAENSAVSTSWAPWYQEKPLIRARVITPDGKEHPLNPETLVEKSLSEGSPDVFSDRKSLTGPLPALTPGAVVEVETVLRHSKSFFDRGVVEYQHFGSSIPVQHRRLTLDAAGSVPLKHLIRLLPELKPRTETVNGRTLTTFEGGPFPVRERGEIFAPSDVPVGPYVAFTTGTDWKQIAARYHEIVETQIANAALDLLGELPSAEIPRLERIARILSLLHSRVRYTSLAFGEASIVPRPPAVTLKRGYGDCKDKAALLVAALRKIGMEAHVAVLLTGPGPDVEPDLPGFGSFDHAIVYVASDPPLWIDATDKLSRPGTLPLQDQDRLALVAAPSTQGLIRTPAAVPGDNVDLKIREIRLSDFGPASVLVETRRPTGAIERDLRNFVDQDRTNVDKSTQSYVKSLFAADKVTKSTFGDPNDLTKPMEVVVEVSGAGRGQTDLREAVVAIPLSNLLSDLPWILREEEAETAADKPWRKNDLVLPEPYVMEWRYKITPPPGFRPRTFPNSEKIPLGPASLTKEFKTNEDGSVSAVFRFDCGRRRMTAAEALELRKGALRIQQEEMLLVGFVQVGTAHLEAGRIREALGEYRKLSVAAPKKALYHAMIARALLVGGLGDAARREAQKGVEIEPDSMVAQQTLGLILEHDLIGRRFELGWDPKGAADAYRAALKVKPDVLTNTLELAILLEHDAIGQRYSSQSSLKEAIDLYKSVAKQIEGTAFENNLNLALVWASNFSELRARLKKPTTPAGQLMLAIALAALEGSDAAIGYCTRSIVAEQTRQAVLAEAGDFLMKLRFYPEAAALLTAGARGAENAANLLGRADRFQKTRRWDGPPPESEEPGEILKRFTYLLMTPEPDFPAMRKLMSRYNRLEEKQTWDQAFAAMRTGVQEIFRKQGMPLQVGGDLTLSLLEPVVEGEKAQGLRVRVPATFGGGTQLWYLLPEDGNLRLLSPAAGALGRLAMDLLDAGKDELARKWLAWAADEAGDGADRDTPEGNPFAVLWKRRKEDDPKSLRIAAAALAAEAPGCAAAVPILEEALKAEGLTPKQSYVLNHALYQAYVSLDRSAEATAVARRLVAAEPDAEIASFYLARMLEKQEKWDEVIAHCKERLQKKSNDSDALHQLQHVEMRLGHFAESVEYGRRILKSGKPDPTAYNNIAWAELLEGKSLDKALQDAQKAVQQSQGSREYMLHTLAAVYADLGRPIEARNVLLQTFRTRSNPEPQDHDWFVLGRIAEEYGARESAVEAYKKTAEAAHADQPQSTNQLSLRRLRLLGEAKQ